MPTGPAGRCAIRRDRAGNPRRADPKPVKLKRGAAAIVPGVVSFADGQRGEFVQTAYPGAVRRPHQMLALIAAFKLFKALACAVLALAAFRFLQPDFAAAIGHWLESLRWLTRYGIAARLLDHLLGLDAHQFLLLGLIASAYSLLYVVQGIGLWRGRRWAEYLVVVESGLLLPIELWELAHRFTAFKLGILLVNLAIVAYLLRLLRAPRAP